MIFASFAKKDRHLNLDKLTEEEEFEFWKKLHWQMYNLLFQLETGFIGRVFYIQDQL